MRQETRSSRGERTGGTEPSSRTAQRATEFAQSTNLSPDLSHLSQLDLSNLLASSRLDCRACAQPSGSSSLWQLESRELPFWGHAADRVLSRQRTEKEDEHEKASKWGRGSRIGARQDRN
eukprot:665637-Hanusia_phi.AAC.2